VNPGVSVIVISGFCTSVAEMVVSVTDETIEIIFSNEGIIFDDVFWLRNIHAIPPINDKVMIKSINVVKTRPGRFLEVGIANSLVEIRFFPVTGQNCALGG